VSSYGESVDFVDGGGIFAGGNPADIFDKVSATLDGKLPEGKVPDLWDGRTAGRVADLIEKTGNGNPTTKN
jgi:hypothetical protein